MPKFRKKPIMIEAIQYFGSPCSFDNVCSFVGKELNPEGSGIVIETLEGNMVASPEDWIIKGINGEFYPCKPDIFEKSYELVE